MYGLYTYIYHKLWLNVGKYTIHWAYGTPPIKHIITECSPTLLSAVTKRDRACSAPPRAWQVDTQMPKNVAIVRGTLWFNLTHEPQKHGSVLLTNPNIPNNTFLYGKSLNHSSWWFQPNPFEKKWLSNWVHLRPKVRGEHKKTYLELPPSRLELTCHAWYFNVLSNLWLAPTSAPHSI